MSLACVKYFIEQRTWLIHTARLDPDLDSQATPHVGHFARLNGLQRREDLWQERSDIVEPVAYRVDDKDSSSQSRFGLLKIQTLVDGKKHIVLPLHQ